MYIEELSRDELMQFSLNALKFQYGRKYNKIKIILSNYILGNDCKILNIQVNMDGIIKPFALKFKDFECELFNKDENNHYTFEKLWGQYVCDTLTDNARLKGEEFSSIDYKKKYNSYWNKIKQDKINQIQQECDEKLFR